jgi:inner membrane protease subunit 2
MIYLLLSLYFPWIQVSLGLLHAHATHILWPPERWQKLESILPPERSPVQSSEEE